jgi:hypothetical protein
MDITKILLLFNKSHKNKQINKQREYVDLLLQNSYPLIIHDYIPISP